MRGDRDVVDSGFNKAAGTAIDGIDAKLNGLSGPGVQTGYARRPEPRNIASSAGSRKHGLHDAVLTHDADAEKVR